MSLFQAAYLSIATGSHRFNGRLILLILCWCGTAFTPSFAGEGNPQANAPDMLANIYHPGMDLADYWVSEKYDGIRGYWDGKKLLTRGGEQVHPPAWFIAGWPDTPLDGELWAGRGQFSVAVSTARSQVPDDVAWRKMRFMVFDLPAHAGTFNERLPAL